MKAIELRWTDSGRELINGKWVDYSREYVPPKDAPQTLVFEQHAVSPRDQFFRVLNMQPKPNGASA